MMTSHSNFSGADEAIVRISGDEVSGNLVIEGMIQVVLRF